MMGEKLWSFNCEGNISLHRVGETVSVSGHLHFTHEFTLELETGT